MSLFGNLWRSIAGSTVVTPSSIFSDPFAEADRLVFKDVYTHFPGGRYRTDGPWSGERFRQDYLVPRLRRAIANCDRVVLDLSGSGLAASFMEEVFGGLVREWPELDHETLAWTMKIDAPTDKSMWPYIHLAQHFIDAAFEARKTDPMRNVLQYPITKAEKLEVLAHCEVLLKADIGDRIGGHQLYALHMIRDDIAALPDDET